MKENESKPGIMALNAMKNMQDKIVKFKKPESPKKRKKVEILTEEKYIEELSNIIQRDFFPDLAKLKAQNEYLEAVEKNDVAKLREIYAKYSGKKPSGLSQRSAAQSPATFETPVSRANSTPLFPQQAAEDHVIDDVPSEEIDKTKSIAENHSLDSFLSKYTSEDNASFQEIIDAATEKLNQKFAVLYNHEKLTADKLAKALTLPSYEKQFTEKQSINAVETWSYKNKNYIMYTPDGVELTKAERMDMINRKQEIAYSNTRLHGNPFNENQNKEVISEVAKSQAKNLSGKIGVDGNVLQPETPMVRGFSFVKTPSPCPGDGGMGTPLMTWGEIEGTPFRLDGSDTPIRPSSGPSFKINEASRRETIALELAEKAGERMRSQKLKASNLVRQNLSSPHTKLGTDCMSPAAKRLLSSKLGIFSPYSRKILTPTPRTPSRSFITTPKNRIAADKLPTPSPTVAKSTHENGNLTDNLLHIPNKRPKAADFF